MLLAVLFSVLLLAGATFISGGSSALVGSDNKVCSAHSSCTHLHGNCCPTVAGTMLNCCAELGMRGNFIWGTGSSAYQSEGFTKEAGRTPSIWDNFALPRLKKVKGGSTADPADQDYIFYKERTLPLIENLGVQHYRLSISWTRVLHSQTARHPNGVENKEGISHYRLVLKELRSVGFEPVVTMWHWDTPLDLENDFKGFRSRRLMPIFFGAYAKLLFKHFGDLVSYWITLNDPVAVVQLGYSVPGSLAPGRCSNRAFCLKGDQWKEPYLVAHTMLVSHGHAFKAWKEAGSQGLIGIALKGDFCEPQDPDEDADVASAELCVERQLGMFFDPIFFGDYPQSMREHAGDRLPVFTTWEMSFVNGSHAGAFFLNYFSGVYARKQPGSPKCGFPCDGGYQAMQKNADGNRLGAVSSVDAWITSYGLGLRKILRWISRRYRSEDGQEIKIFVTANGWPDKDEGADKSVVDLDRCNFFREHLGNMSLAVHEDAADVRGYFAWSLLDGFEWNLGYTSRMGLTYVDYSTQDRIRKLSSRWFSEHVAPLGVLPSNGVLPECQADIMTTTVLPESPKET